MFTKYTDIPERSLLVITVEYATAHDTVNETVVWHREAVVGLPQYQQVWHEQHDGATPDVLNTRHDEIVVMAAKGFVPEAVIPLRYDVPTAALDVAG